MRGSMFFASRCMKEILRDKLTVLFGVGFPAVLLLLLSAINAGIPKDAGMTLFEIQSLVPGVVVFGLSFLSLFAGMLISKDRGSSLRMRLACSPLPAAGFLFGYTLPLLPIAFCQTVFAILSHCRLGLRPVSVCCRRCFQRFFRRFFSLRSDCFLAHCSPKDRWAASAARS